MKGFTIYDLLRRSSCVRIMMLLALFTFNCSLFISEAQAQDAFYIYQNDGHFDGFFYDEIQKISYSFLDTLGIEHDEIVSQEIVTADSTYRIMLSAIDSVGFVQPEVKTNPRLRVYDKFYTYDKSINKDWEFWIQCVPNIEELLGHTIDNPFFRFPNLPGFLPSDMIPQIGDVLVSYGGYYGDDPQKGWSYKVYKIEVDPEQPNVSIAYLKPIDDITDIFQQFVSVEEYGYNEEGNMTRRRVAGRPDLTVGKFPKKAKGQWEGDLFNFALNAHIPLYDENDLTISIDPSIEGKLNIKTAWNFSLLGDKYIGITTKLTSGVSVSFSVDGKIKDFFPGGIGGLFGGVPIPATCPIVMLDIAPDAFLRGEAHVNFKMTSPKIQTAMWSKLEIKNWIPSMDIGFNNSDGGNADVGVDPGSAGVTMSLNGFIQAGMLFPMTFKSLPLIKKLFDSEIGGKWFLGPKLAADFTLDLTTAPWEDVAAYNQMKNVTASVHMLDADYEVKGTIKTAFSGKKEVTLADGSISLFPPLDAKLVPEFDDCEDYFEDGGQDVEGYTIKRRVLAFKPNGAVIMPVKIGTIRTRMPATTYDLIDTNYDAPTSYYHIHQMMGQEVPKSQWARFVLSYPQDHYLMSSQEYTIWPCVSFTGQYPYYKATPEYKFVYGMRAKIEGDTVLLNHDGTMFSTVRIIPLEGEITPPKFEAESSAWLDVKPIEGGGNEITVNSGKINVHPRDTVYWQTVEYPVKGKIEGTHFLPLFDEETRKAHPSLNNRNISVPIYFLPNKTMIPKVTGLLENHGWSCTTTSLGDGGGWHVHATSEIDEYRIFDIIPSKKHPGILEVRNFQARDKWSESSDDGWYKCVNEYSTDFYGFLGGLTPSSGEKEVDIILEKTIYNDEVANPTYTHKRTREGDNVTTTTTIPAGGSKIRLIFQ